MFLIKIVDWNIKMSGTLNVNIKKRKCTNNYMQFDIHIGEKRILPCNCFMERSCTWQLRALCHHLESNHKNYKIKLVYIVRTIKYMNFKYQLMKKKTFSIFNTMNFTSIHTLLYLSPYTKSNSLLFLEIVNKSLLVIHN